MKRLATLLILTLLILPATVKPASAGLLHILATSQLYYIDQPVAALGGELHRVDILFEGTPEPGQTIFDDITIFPPFTSFDTDNQSFIHIFPDEPILDPDALAPFDAATFTTDLDWGVPGGATPFAFVEYGAGGIQIEGTLYNAGPVGGAAELLVDGADSPARAADGSGSSAPPYAAIAGAAAGALAVVAGGWYARRRWLR